MILLLLCVISIKWLNLNKNETEVVVSLAESALTPFDHNSQSMSEQHNENNKLVNIMNQILACINIFCVNFKYKFY